jgi:hypothetical protein
MDLSMRLKNLWWATSIIVALAGAWYARHSWRMSRGLVTVRVRNAPVAEVIRQLERQTGQKIALDQRLNTRVTLQLRNKPLSAVLDRLAFQCGANWSTVYAVYESGAALKGLELALRGDRKLQEAGWKTIAPIELSPGDVDPEHPGAVWKTGAGGPAHFEDSVAAGARGPVKIEEDVVAGGPEQMGGPGPLSGGGVVKIVRQRGGPNSGPVEEETWSPTELVLESKLSPRLKDDPLRGAGPEDAAAVAREVKGRWTAYYALRKSALNGLGLTAMPKIMRLPPGGPGRLGDKAVGQGGALSEPKHEPMLPGADLETAARQQRLDDFGLLTPEQRVQRARERPSFGPHP